MNLAPLAVRRDIAMLGLIHRAMLGRGPAQFREFFQPDIDARKKGVENTVYNLLHCRTTSAILCFRGHVLQIILKTQHMGWCVFTTYCSRTSWRARHACEAFKKVANSCEKQSNCRLQGLGSDA